MKPILLAKTTDLTRAEWLEVRRQGIGGSDAAAIAGLNPWRGPLSVYLSKLGASPEVEQTENMFWGQEFEDPIAKVFSQRTGMKIRKCNFVLQHPIHQFMLANVDRMVDDPDEEGEGVLEVKYVGARMVDEWADDKVPEHVQLQGQHYLAVTDTQYVWFAPLLAGVRLKPIKVMRDERLITALIKLESDFWRHVQDRTPPPIDDSPEAKKILTALYPESRETSVTIEPDTYRRLVSARQRVIDAEKEARGLENQIKETMKEAESAYIPGESKPCVTWRGSIVKRLDVAALEEAEPEICARYFKESTTRRFLVKETK
jgi:putative phage-type endonuclease